jgi:hypothetical protein
MTVVLAALTTGEGRRRYETCVEAAAASERIAEWSAEALSAARFGKPLEVRPRLGQTTLRFAVLDAYFRRCAITGERSLPVVEALRDEYENGRIYYEMDGRGCATPLILKTERTPPS